MATECLVQATDARRTLEIRLRFLQLTERSACVGPQETWQEGVERDVRISSLDLSALASQPARQSFAFSAGRETDGSIERKCERIEGVIEAKANDVGKDLLKLRIDVFNIASLDSALCDNREEALMHSLVSAHTILNVKGGEFISLLDPSDEFRASAAECKNSGAWPVLVGEQGQRDTMLCSPIILYDYPQIAPESPGTLFDGTEIDEILTLRIMTLTDDEKLEMQQGDDRVRRILERTESMPLEQLIKMHGALRGLRRADQEVP
jgi:hydrogenase maturation protease